MVAQPFQDALGRRVSPGLLVDDDHGVTDGAGTSRAILAGLVNGLAALTLSAGASLFVYVPG